MWLFEPKVPYNRQRRISAVNPRTLRSAVRHKFVQLGLISCIAAGSASASVVGIWGGVDNGVGPGGIFTNSAAEEAAFLNVLGATAQTITFEGVATLATLGGGAS